MKLKEIAHLLGIRPKPRSYGFQVKEFELPDDGPVEYAQWLHPLEHHEPIPRQMAQDAVRELRKFLRPGDVAIDIGAHSGDTTIPMALAVGPRGCVLALEPNRYVFPVLEQNARMNLSKTRIVPLMFAATPADGQFEFEYSDPGFCNGGRHEGISRWRHAHAFRLQVQGKNLQSYLRREYASLLPRLRYIKVDAEGYDLTILNTLTALIAETRPFVRAEVYKHTSRTQRESLIGFFLEQRYCVHRIENDAHYLGQPVQRQDVERWRHFDIFCRPLEADLGTRPAAVA